MIDVQEGFVLPVDIMLKGRAMVELLVGPRHAVVAALEACAGNVSCATQRNCGASVYST